MIYTTCFPIHANTGKIFGWKYLNDLECCEVLLEDTYYGNVSTMYATHHKGFAYMDYVDDLYELFNHWFKGWFKISRVTTPQSRGALQRKINEVTDDYNLGERDHIIIKIEYDPSFSQVLFPLTLSRWGLGTGDGSFDAEHSYEYFVGDDWEEAGCPDVDYAYDYSEKGRVLWELYQKHPEIKDMAPQIALTLVESVKNGEYNVTDYGNTLYWDPADMQKCLPVRQHGVQQVFTETMKYFLSGNQLNHRYGVHGARFMRDITPLLYAKWANYTALVDSMRSMYTLSIEQRYELIVPPYLELVREMEVLHENLVMLKGKWAEAKSHVTTTKQYESYVKLLST